jgi:hypothetical protein
VAGFGKEPRYLNTVTGQVETESNKTNAFWEGALQMVPFAGQLRDVISAGKTPYDSSTTVELAIDRLTGSGSPDLYQPPKKDSGRSKLPPALQVSLALIGLPGSKYDVTREKNVARGAKVKLTQDRMAQNRKIARQKLARASGDAPSSRYSQVPRIGGDSG